MKKWEKIWEVKQQNNSEMYRKLSILLFLCFLLFFKISTSAQFAIVSDSDGFVNVREDGSRNCKVIDKLNNGHLLYCFENKGNRTNIDYTLLEKERNGYIYKGKYKLISDFISVPTTKKYDNKIVFKKDSITVTITSVIFEKKKHRFKYVKDYQQQKNL